MKKKVMFMVIGYKVYNKKPLFLPLQYSSGRSKVSIPILWGCNNFVLGSGSEVSIFSFRIRIHLILIRKIEVQKISTYA